VDRSGWGDARARPDGAALAGHPCKDRGGRRHGRRHANRAAGGCHVYLAEIERFHAERKAAAERAAAERAESQAHLASVCPHCDLARSYQGVRNLQVGSVGAELIMGELLSVSNAKVHWYVCPSCGSVEQFAVGVVPHPLAGNRPPGQPG
jgi:phage FluMu protein Com